MYSLVWNQSYFVIAVAEIRDSGIGRRK